jgi:hypothetical protein
MESPPMTRSMTDPATAPMPPDDTHPPHPPRSSRISWMRAVRPGTHVVHIMPVRDLRPHRAGVDCECQPGRTMPPFSGDHLIVLLHQAWDCREYYHTEEESTELAALLDRIADDTDTETDSTDTDVPYGDLIT